MTSSLNDVWSALIGANSQLADVIETVETRAEAVVAQIQQHAQDRADALAALLSESIDLTDVSDALNQVVTALEDLTPAATLQTASTEQVTWESLFSETFEAIGDSFAELHETVHADVADFVDGLDGSAPTPAEVKELVDDLGDAFHTFLASVKDALHPDTLA